MRSSQWSPPSSSRSSESLRRRAHQLIASGAVIILLLALSGHSAYARYTPLTVTLDVAHIAAAAIWLGGLVELGSVALADREQLRIRRPPVRAIRLRDRCHTGRDRPLRRVDPRRALVGPNRHALRQDRPRQVRPLPRRARLRRVQPSHHPARTLPPGVNHARAGRTGNDRRRRVRARQRGSATARRPSRRGRRPALGGTTHRGQGEPGSAGRPNHHRRRRQRASAAGFGDPV